MLYFFIVIFICFILLHVFDMRRVNKKLNKSLKESAAAYKLLEISNQEIAQQYKVISELQKVMKSALWVYKYDEAGRHGKMRRSQEHLGCLARILATRNGGKIYILMM